MVRKKFLWSGDKNKKKHHLVNWRTVCMPKEQGGLGILDLDLMNISLLSKWLWKLFNDKGPWQEILSRKYLQGKTLCQVAARPGDSHFWQGLMEIKHIFWACCKIEIGNGEKTSFWEDHWTADASLASMFPRLFSVSTNKEVTVKEVIEQRYVSLHFRRAIVGELHAQWVQLVQMLNGVSLRDEPDRLRWTLTRSGNFSVKSLYLAMQLSNTVPYTFLWKVKIPLRVKTFLWLVLKKSILTRDVLLKRGGKCESKCLLCGKNESIAHLFFLCPLARYVWNVVSSAFGFNCHFSSVDHCISSWLRGYGKKKKKPHYSWDCCCNLEYLENKESSMLSKQMA